MIDVGFTCIALPTCLSEMAQHPLPTNPSSRHASSREFKKPHEYHEYQYDNHKRPEHSHRSNPWNNILNPSPKRNIEPQRRVKFFVFVTKRLFRERNTKVKRIGWKKTSNSDAQNRYSERRKEYNHSLISTEVNIVVVLNKNTPEGPAINRRRERRRRYRLVCVDV